MEPLRTTIRQMIAISDAEMDAFLAQCHAKTFRRLAVVSEPGRVTDDIYFISRGIIRVVITDNGGSEHTVHFALENQFVTDYSSFLLRTPSLYRLQALEETEVVVLPRPAVEWGYRRLAQGERLGRLIAEFYFVYHDHRIKNLYARTPKERYDTITQVFPDIHNRAPQHMIASYLGITPVHLSRLKKAAAKKV